MGVMRNVYRILAGILEGYRSFGKPARRLNIVIKYVSENLVCGCELDSNVGFKILTAVTMINAIFWVVAPSN
jgi:hypothetical protein